MSKTRKTYREAQKNLLNIIQDAPVEKMAKTSPSLNSHEHNLSFPTLSFGQEQANGTTAEYFTVKDIDMQELTFESLFPTGECKFEK